MKALFISLVAVLAVAGCSTTSYMDYAGASVERGKGGAFLVVDGMQVWKEGRPNRPYRIVGVITDSRPDGPWTMGARTSTVVHLAKLHGGDAVVLTSEQREFLGFSTNSNGGWDAASYPQNRCSNAPVYTSGTAYGSSTTTPMYQARSRFLVVRFL